MQNGKLIQLLQTLSQKEVQEFAHFLAGFYPTYPLRLTLLQHLQQFHPKFVHHQLDRNYILTHVLKLDNALEKRVQNEASELYGCLEEFLIWKKISSKAYSFERDKLLLEIYKEQKLDKFFEKKLEKARKDLKEKPLDMWYFLRFMELADSAYYLSNTTKFNKGATDINEAMELLDSFYVSAKLKYSAELKNRENISQRRYTIKLLDEITAIAKKTPEDIYQELYLLALAVLDAKSEEDFTLLKDALFTYAAKIDPQDQHILLIYLINFTALQIRLGQQKFYRLAFDLYKFGLDEKTLIVEGGFPAESFLNITNLACNFGELEWAKTFIQENSKYISPVEVRENMQLFATAKLEFTHRHYNKVLELIREVDFIDVSMAIQAKALIVMSYIENGQDYEVIADFIRAFDTYLKRDATLNKGFVVDGWLNFLKIAKKIISTHLRKDVLEEIDKMDSLVYKQWLKEKAQACLK